MSVIERLRGQSAAFHRAESGALTVFGLYIFMASVVLSAIAVDISQLYAARVQLQVAADVAAHAALYSRDSLDEDAARLRAFDLAKASMPTGRYGEVLKSEDIKFGTWNAATRTFKIVPGARTAAMVTTSRLTSKANPVSVFLMQFLGKNSFDIRTQAVFEGYTPSCLKEGFMANGIVDIQSNNAFSGGFCIHSNTYVSMNNNNTFEPGTIVSMPDLSQLDIPGSGYTSNTGLADALRQSRHNIRVVDRISTIIAGLREYGGRYQPTYINSAAIVNVTSNTLSQGSIVPGRVHNLTCNNGKVTIPSNLVLSKVVIVTDCEVKMSAGIVLKDAIIATTNTGARSFNGSSSFTLGIDDNCAAGGGATLVTMGGMSFAAMLNIWGSQLLAVKDVSFAANANGIKGASIVAGGRIDGTSNMSMGFCNGGGMEQILSVPNFRLAG